MAALGLAVAVEVPAHHRSSTTSPAVIPVKAAQHAPIGRSIDLYPTSGGVRARGWAFDPDSPKTVLTVYATVDGRAGTSSTAGVNRSDVARAYPQAGQAHGYNFVALAPEGRHTVCIRARNIQQGTDTTLGCTTRTLNYGPIGSLDVLDTRPGHLHVGGWAIDPDRASAVVTTVIGIDGHNTVVQASNRRPDVSNVRSGAGPNHGFDVTLATTQGQHTVCVTMINIGYGTNTSLGCRAIVLNDNPLGILDPVVQYDGKLRVRGAAYDRDNPTTPLQVSLRVDGGAPTTVLANQSRNDVAQANPSAGKLHGFDVLLSATEATHTVCAVATNIGYGSDSALPCQTFTLNFRPTASLTSIAATSTGLAYTGWVTDPDTSAAISVRVSVDGATPTTVVANGASSPQPGHAFGGTAYTTSGKHTVCAVAVNVLYGTRDSVQVCKSITLALSPLASVSAPSRSGSNLVVNGWAFDPDSAAPLNVAMTLDGTSAGDLVASQSRPDVGRVYPSAGPSRGFAVLRAVDDGEHTVCFVARNVGGGSDTDLGCQILNAVHPVPPSAPTNVSATSDYNAATVSWTRPASDGGAPWTSYVISTSGGGPTVTASATATSIVITGLKTKTAYTYSVTAVNVAGSSAAGVSPSVTTQAGPAPQTSPAPISTSRYIRNIRGSSAAEMATMRAEGASDAAANPSNHRYLSLLDIGGQNQAYGGVVLSATTRFVGYGDLVNDIKAYIDGYHSAQRSTAPVTIAIGTNNDMDVNAATGAAWANNVINPLVSYARQYSGITIVGANDIEPGFSASYGATRNWLTGYLANTSAGFVYNGSADGCAYTTTNRNCNNGWSMAGLYQLAAGAAPNRIVNLPQIYNFTMADQWMYISLTGVNAGQPRINFGGPLTEYTACAQAGNSCGSIGGVSAWQRLWNNLQSVPALKVASLPYSTDLRIDQ